MNRRTALFLALAVLVFVAGTTVAGYFAYRTFANSGERAVAVMNHEERNALMALSSVDRAMSVEQVYEKLGAPSQDLYLLAKWKGFGGSPLSEARVYFIDGHPRKIRWIKVGFFVYERTL